MTTPNHSTGRNNNNALYNDHNFNHNYDMIDDEDDVSASQPGVPRRPSDRHDNDKDGCVWKPYSSPRPTSGTNKPHNHWVSPSPTKPRALFPHTTPSLTPVQQQYEFESHNKQPRKQAMGGSAEDENNMDATSTTASTDVNSSGGSSRTTSPASVVSSHGASPTISQASFVSSLVVNSDLQRPFLRTIPSRDDIDSDDGHNDNDNDDDDSTAVQLGTGRRTPTPTAIPQPNALEVTRAEPLITTPVVAIEDHKGNANTVAITTATLPQSTASVMDNNFASSDAHSVPITPPSPTPPSSSSAWDQVQSGVRHRLATILESSNVATDNSLPPLVVSSWSPNRDHNEDDDDDNEHGATLLALQSQLEQAVQHQSTANRAVAAAFYQGVLWYHQHLHVPRVQQIQHQHQTQLQLLQPQPATDVTTASEESLSLVPQGARFRGATRPRGQQAPGNPSSETTRQPRRNANRQYHKEQVLDADDDDNYTVATAMTTMSCRELSIARIQRAAAKASWNQRQQRQHHERIISTENTTASQDQVQQPGQQQQQDAARIQQLLEELQQAEARQKKLETQLKQAGVVLAEDIPYQRAKDQVARIAQRMQAIGSCHVTHDDPTTQAALREEYFRLEQDMEKYSTALQLTDEWQDEQRAIYQAWEDAQLTDNKAALRAVRRHLPVNIRLLSIAGCQAVGVSKDMAKKIHRTNVLQILRRDPKEIVRWHPSTLETLRVTGLTITERRALHAHLRPVAQAWGGKGSGLGITRGDPLQERKTQWIQMMTTNFQEALQRYQHHVASTDGRTDATHSCNCIGKQCPVRLDLELDYFAADGPCFPVEAVYETSCVTQSSSNSPDSNTNSSDVSSAKEQRSEERLQALKQHYHCQPNKLQLVSAARQACDSMETLLEDMELDRLNWIRAQLDRNSTSCDKNGDTAAFMSLAVLRRSLVPLLQRCGIAKEGFHNVNDGTPTTARSAVELLLCEDVYHGSLDYLQDLQHHVDHQCQKKALAVRNHDDDPSCENRRIATAMAQVRQLLEDMHHRTVLAVNHIDDNALPDRRPRTCRTELMAQVWKEQRATTETNVEANSKNRLGEDTVVPSTDSPPGNRKKGRRGSLMAAILAGKKETKNSGRSGALLAAIATRRRTTEETDLDIGSDNS